MKLPAAFLLLASRGKAEAAFCSSSFAAAAAATRPSASFASAPSPLLAGSSSGDHGDHETMDGDGGGRRAFLHHGGTWIAGGCGGLLSTMISPTPSVAAERAVGSAEQNCREAGDCLQKGDWDGAVGWNWGGKDRCDASDPRCGPGGKLLDAPPSGEAVPTDDERIITDVVEMTLSVGKTGGDRVVLRIGLYGEDSPTSVRQMVNLCSDAGIVTSSPLLFEEGYGAESSPVRLANGGVLQTIYPGKRLDFGLPSQGAAFARRMGRNKAGDEFLPQPRPSSRVADEASREGGRRNHDAAGLLSVPANGIGYGGSGFEPDDSAYASSFQITAASVPAMDREGRRVIGRLMDEESMAALARFAFSPTQKGLKGIVPGQDAGPPLVRVTVASVAVSQVGRSGAGSSAAMSAPGQS